MDTLSISPETRIEETDTEGRIPRREPSVSGATVANSSPLSGTDVATGEDDSLPALFWDGTEDWINEDNCADFAALQSLKNDEQTPEERADNYKRKGNDALKYKQNKVYVRKAVQQYTLALMEKFDNPELESILRSNRAHAALLLGNLGKALDDATQSVRLQPRNVKGWFRAAKSSLGLQKLDECVEFCRHGLSVEEDNKDLKALLKAANKALDRRADQLRHDEAAKVKVSAYLREIEKRQLKLGPPTMGTGERMPELSTDVTNVNAMKYWVLFVYPESMQTDVIESFDERSTFADQLDDMFGAHAPPLEWDSSGNYARQRVELYYQTNAVTAYPMDVLECRLLEKARGSRGVVSKSADRSWSKSDIDTRDQYMVRINENNTLADIVAAQHHIIAGHPVIYVVSTGTEFREKFLAGEWRI